VSGEHTIGRWLRDRARATPGRVAIDFHDRLVTFGELDDRADALAAALVERGLGRGDRVATLTGNSPEHVIALFACAKAGLLLAPLSWRLAPAEIAYQLDDADPAVFLVDDEHAALADAALATANVSPERAHLEPRNSLLQGKLPADVRDDNPLLLVYTSGTTGKPKGALLTHASCFWTNLGFDLATGVSGDDVVLQVLPQYHCGGWNVQPLLAWWKGAKVVLERAFDPARCLRLIEEKRVTTMMGVPANYLFMSQQPEFARADLSSLRRAVVGGAPMPEPLLEAWQRRGVEIVQGYGLTEAAPNVLCLPPEDASRKAGYAGKPYPFVEVRLSDAGELQVRGPNVFAGYWRNPEATAAAFTGDGWLRTGDVAARDDEGCYRIVGRLKDMYISGGENVYPAEVEAVLHEHPAVADAAVVGVASERWGETGLAFVVLEPDGAASEDELVEHCRARLARFKVPSGVRFLDELPRSGMNKVLKGELLALARDDRVTA
jgi:fatty-acyl-CoA synthase